jgi:hypothetical protein
VTRGRTKAAARCTCGACQPAGIGTRALPHGTIAARSLFHTPTISSPRLVAALLLASDHHVIITACTTRAARLDCSHCV